MTFRSDMTQKEYDHNRYMANRDAILRRQLEYDREYRAKGLRKPRKQAKPRSIRDHERYLEKRDEILAYQKRYRETHREEIRERQKRWRMERTVKKLRQQYQEL